MSTYVIGDLQGCRQPMQILLTRIHARTERPSLAFIGDLVNRGPQSLPTLRQIAQSRAAGDPVLTVLGNHDLHLLAVAHGIRKSHRSDTIKDILDAPDCVELLDWIRHQPLAHFENGHLLVHAGVVPQWSAQQTLAYAHEVESVLRGPDWVDFLREMYGNAPDTWDDGLTGVDRLRCIVNVLTRIRFCTPEGKMEFAAKGEIDAAPPGYLPWFDVPGRRTEDVTVVFGHWSALGLLMRPNLIGLDTGCIWGGKLTAVCLDDRSVLQVDCAALPDKAP